MNTYDMQTIAEYSVIGSVLIGGWKTLQSLTIAPEHFSNKLCAACIEVLRELYQTHSDVDPVMLSTEMRRREYSITADDLFRMMDLAPSASVVKYNESLVVQYSKLRAARDAVSDFVLGDIQPGTVDDSIADAILSLTAIAKGEQDNGFAQISEYLSEACAAYAYSGKEIRFDTGFSDCDRLLQGIRQTDFVIIAARPAVGKSAFAGQISVHMARLGAKVALYSLEMPGRQIAERMMAKAAPIELSAFRNRNPEGKWVTEMEMEEAAQKLQKLKIYVSRKTSITPSIIYRDIASSDKDIVIIDHIGLMRADRKTENRTNEIAQISRDMRLIAMSTKIPIVVLCQLNRASEMRTDKRPQLSDLRDSGSLEQDATTVIALSQYGHEDDSNVLFEVLKNRQGQCGKVILHFNKPYMDFTQTTIKYEDGEPRRRREGL